MGTKRKAAQEPVEDQHDDLDSSSSGLTEESKSQTSSDSGSSGSYPSVSSGGAADSDDEADPADTVQVDFEFFDPQEGDFHGLKALLQTYLDGEAFSCSELVEAIIQQRAVGSVIKTGEGDDPIGLLTVLSTAQPEGATAEKPLQEFRGFLLRSIKDAADQEKLRAAWDGAGTGLIVSERLVNCPPQLAPPLVRALFSEISTAAKDSGDYQFQRYLLVSRAYTDEAGAAAENEDAAAADGANGAAPSSGKSKRKKKSKPRNGAPLIVYGRPEDEFYHKRAAWSTTFPVADRPVARDELRQLRLVMLVEADQVKAARKELDEVVGMAPG